MNKTYDLVINQIPFLMEAIICLEPEGYTRTKMNAVKKAVFPVWKHLTLTYSGTKKECIFVFEKGFIN